MQGLEGRHATKRGGHELMRLILQYSYIAISGKDDSEPTDVWALFCVKLRISNMALPVDEELGKGFVIDEPGFLGRFEKRGGHAEGELCCASLFVGMRSLELKKALGLNGQNGWPTASTKRCPEDDWLCTQPQAGRLPQIHRLQKDRTVPSINTSALKTSSPKVVELCELIVSGNSGILADLNLTS